MSDLLRMMPASVAVYYPNSLCIANRTEVKNTNNWFNSKFENLVLTIEECNSRPGENKTCETTDEVQKFMDEKIFYFIN